MGVVSTGVRRTNPSNDSFPPRFRWSGAPRRDDCWRTFGDRRIEELPCGSSASAAISSRASRSSIDRGGGRRGYASLAIPGVFPPVAVDGRLLVDGGVLDNLPVATMARTGEGPVIAVDVTGRIGQFGHSHRGRSRAPRDSSGASHRQRGGGSSPRRDDRADGDRGQHRHRRGGSNACRSGDQPTRGRDRPHGLESASAGRELGRQAAREALEGNRDMLSGSEPDRAPRTLRHWCWRSRRLVRPSRSSTRRSSTSRSRTSDGRSGGRRSRRSRGC